MAASVHALQELGSSSSPNLLPLRMTAFLHQDVRTPPTMASDNSSPSGLVSQGASLDHLLAHLESSKQALEHQVQQLLQENRLSKSAKKEQQWQMEGDTRLHSKLDSLNAALMQKEERIRHLEKELRDARGSIQYVQSRCREAEKENERGALERASMQADLEDARSSFQNLEREYQLKHDVVEKQRGALESLANKLEKQKESFQCQLEDARMKLIEAEEREQKYELSAQLASQHMAEKEWQLKSLRDAHEKLLAVQKGKRAEERHEVKEVILLLESTHAKCEEQKAFIKELEHELGRIRKEAHQLDARVAAAEADASSKSSMLEKLELKHTSSHAVLSASAKTQIEDLKAQVETVKKNLRDVENTLCEENALRFKAECAVNEYKVREKSFLKVEQDAKLLQEEVKWRNEQFESLEDAHHKVRHRFHEGRSMWASEKAAILKDIEALTEDVQSRDVANHDLRSRVKLLEQSLSHEENCRKLLEFQLADAEAGLESVSAEYLAAQSILESLREISKKELAFLKDTLVEKDRQLKELHVKQTQIDRDQKELVQMEAELDRYKSRCEQLQQAQGVLAMEIGVETRNKVLDFDLHEERESLMRSLADAEATIARKEVEMKELEMELDRTRTLSELLRSSLSEAEEGHGEARQTLEQVSASLSAKEQHALELETELERLQAVVNDVRECDAEAERRIALLEDRLRDGHRELHHAQSNDLRFSADLDVEEHEEVALAMRSECEALQRQVMSNYDLEKQREKVVAESREQKQLHQREKLEHLATQCTLKGTQLNDLLDQIEREKLVISTLEARCTSSERELSKQLVLPEQAREELIAEKLSARAHQERAQILDASLSAEAAAKDASLQEIKDTLHELTLLCKGSAQAATGQQTLRISSIEAKLAKQEGLHGRIDGRLVSLSGELNAVVEEVERMARGVAYLNIELNSLKDDSKLTKTEFETRFRAVEGLFSSSFAELKEISEQVGKMNAARISIADILNTKEDDLDLMNQENDRLNVEKSALDAHANVLEEKLLKLVKEAESNKAIIGALNVSMKAAEEGVATRSGELHELHGKLEEAENKNHMQLCSVAEQARGLERKLRETEEIVHDKEQRLAASEWAVQQLAGEIAKSKSYLAQKERDELAASDRLEHSEAQLKVKEREVMELQCDLENAVTESNEKHALVQQLTLSKEEVGHVLELTKRALEEKTAALATSEVEVKRLLETQRLTEEALETCKERLSNELETNVGREKDMKSLCKDIERANQEASLADVDVKRLQERLKCLESTTEARLESFERKMEKGAADLAAYQENCAGLLALLEKKDARIHQLELEVAHADNELEKQVMLAEQSAQELHFVSEQLQSKTKMHSSLKVELATVDVLVKELKTQKRGLEEEVRGLKSSLSLATRDLSSKALEIEEQRRSIEQLESLISQQGDAHAVKWKELQITSNAVQERDSQLSNFQSALNAAHDDLQTAHGLVSMKEGEKRVLSLRLSELESLVEKGQSQISQLQTSLQFARVNLEAESERVWQQVAARNEMATELDAWKGKAAALTESNAATKAEFESSISRLQAEVKDWKEVAEHTQSRNAELEESMQVVQESVVVWEKIITSLADEGDVATLQMELFLKQVHDEFRSVHADLANAKDLMTHTRREARTLKAEFLSTIEDSQDQIEALKEQASALALATRREEREQHEMPSQHLHAVISDLEIELSVWKAKAVMSSASEVALQEEARSQLNKWRQRAEEWESSNKLLERVFLDFEHSFLECKSDAASIADLEDSMKFQDIQVSFRTLRKEVEEAKSEMLELKEVAALEVKETKRVQLAFEACVRSLQVEVEAWKEKAAVAAEEGVQIKDQFEDLLKNLQGELKNWKQFEALAREEGRFTQIPTVANDASVVRNAPEDDESSVVTPNSINPFHQEDEGCSVGWEAQESDDAATQLDGWKSKLSMAAKEGRMLTRQFKASFKHLQFEFESRKQNASKMVKHGSFVHRHDDTGLESLVNALQEEAVEIRAELADWKNKAASAAHDTAALKEDMERTISKLKAEVEGWKDRSAMSAGQRIVARRQLEDFAKHVKSLTAEVQKWKDVATESNEGSTTLQSDLERVRKENEELRGELNEWMQKALELNCVLKDLEMELAKWKQRAESRDGENQQRIEELERLRAEVEQWKNVAATAEEEGTLSKVELLDTLGKFEDELEVMSSNSIGGCSTAEGRSFKEEDLDCSSQTSGRISNEWRYVASEVEMSLQAEVEDWKTEVACAEKEQEDLRKSYETTVKELRLEVEAWKESAESIAKDARVESVELEKKLKDLEAKAGEATDHVAEERKRSSLERAEVHAEVQIWKQRAADAAEECTFLRDAYDNVVKELQAELALWKEKSETATEECRSMRADLETVVQDLQNQVHVWKQKAEAALENVVKSQEYEDLIKALEEELCLWAQRSHESKVLQLQLENEQVHLKESLTATQSELQKWKDTAAVVTTSIRSVHEKSRLTAISEEDEVNIDSDLTEEVDDDVNIDPLTDVEDEVHIDSLNAFESQLQKWKSKAEQGELLQLQLEDLLAETQTELKEWKQKAADFGLAAELLKEELESLVKEGRLEKEELLRSTAELEAGLRLWRERAQDSENQLGSSKAALQKWEEKAAVITQSTRSLMEDFDLPVEGQLEKQKFYASISALKASALVWKEKVAESESMQLQLKATLLETQTELQAWKDKAAVAIATNSLQAQAIDSILEDNRQQKETLCNTIKELEAELLDWKSRAQEGVFVQLQLERALSEMEEKEAAAATDAQAVKDELDRTIAESSAEIHQLYSVITGLETEMKEKADGSRFPQLLQLQTSLTETQSQLQEWQEKATVTSQVEEELPQSVEDIRAETGKLDNFIRALKDELLQWKEKAEDLELLQVQLTSSLKSSEEELQSWKDKALNAEMVTDPDLRNAVSSLATEEKAQDSEFLHQQTKKSLTDTQTEIKDLKEKIAAFSSFTDSLKDELNRAKEVATTLTTQLSTHEQNEASLQRLNRQLKAELVVAREEASSRKQKMTEILTQLEGTSNSQQELQKKLHLAQHRLLRNENDHSQAESVNLEMAAKANFIGSDDIHDIVSCNSSPEAEIPSLSHHDPSKSEAPDFKLDIFRVSVNNPAVDKMRQELFSLKSLVSKLEHVRGNDGEQSQASSVAGDDEALEVAEETIPRASLLSREDEELLTEVNGVPRPELLLLQKQVENSKACQEGAHPARKRSDAQNRSRPHNSAVVARCKVLADVNGNSPRAAANYEKASCRIPLSSCGSRSDAVVPVESRTPSGV